MSGTCYKKTEKDGVRLRIMTDDCPESPRDWDNLGTMVCWNKRYSLGDKHDYKYPQDFWEHLASQLGIDVTEDEGITDEQRDVVESKVVILPLWLYDHSGLSLRTYKHGYHSQWDCGQVGWIYILLIVKLKKNMARSMKKTLKRLKDT